MWYGQSRAARVHRSHSRRNEVGLLIKTFKTEVMRSIKIMRVIVSIFPLLTLLGIMIQLQSCDDGKGPSTPTQTLVDQETALMTAVTWKLQRVTADGVDQEPLFKSMTLKFSNGTFAVTNGGVVWPANGTWKFVDSSGTDFIRDDGVSVTLTNLTATSMTLKLIWATKTIGPGRSASVMGSYVFDFGG
jgi:hypothetical protein